MNTYSWIDRSEYPFESKFIQLEMGKMHYVDEGNGVPIVMVHGNPTWSFLYRHFIKGLSGDFRCVAPDHLGFGFSDKPYGWSYKPEEHAKNLENLINQLELKEIILVVQDWGGPIGLSYAVNHPENVSKLIILNTWMWPVNTIPRYIRISGILGGLLGRFAIMRFNLFTKVILKKMIINKTHFTENLHLHYKNVLLKPTDRKGNWVFPYEIIASTTWLESLWSKRQQIANKDAIILWGLKDLAFTEQELKVWKELFQSAKVITFENAGHYIQEDINKDLCPIIKSFVQGYKK